MSTEKPIPTTLSLNIENCGDFVKITGSFEESTEYYGCFINKSTITRIYHESTNYYVIETHIDTYKVTITKDAAHRDMSDEKFKSFVLETLAKTLSKGH